MDASKYAVIKITDPQADFKPIKYSDLQEKLSISDASVLAVMEFYTEEAKKQKQEEIRKCAQNWCLI